MKSSSVLNSKVSLPLTVLCAGCLLWLYATSRPAGEEKIHGISFVGSRRAVEQGHIEPVKSVGAEHAAVMPFAFLRSTSSDSLLFNTPNQWYGERLEGARQYIELLHANGIKVMVKPQIWVWGGTFTGEISMNSDEEWQQFERSYRDFILLYAGLAQEEGAAIFCLGTELDRFVQARTSFWVDLIARVRKIYAGKLTYAANWDEYGRVPFWEDLDYIGVDGYFPLSDERDPEVAVLARGWARWKSDLASCSSASQRPVLFTEYGYRSMDYAAHKPWLVDRNQMTVNTRLQARSYEVLFEELWDEEWFAGGFLWKWFIEHDRAGGTADNRFTPQNKEAQQVISRHYGKGKPDPRD